jgi:hypothetical protein
MTSPDIFQKGISMIVKVQLLAFGQPGEVREVNIPEDSENTPLLKVLGTVFYYGQNDFQSLPHPSLSSGDVIEFDGNKYMICSVGFRLLTEEEYQDYLGTSRHDRDIKRMRMQSNVV